MLNVKRRKNSKTKQPKNTKSIQTQPELVKSLRSKSSQTKQCQNTLTKKYLTKIGNLKPLSVTTQANQTFKRTR